MGFELEISNLNARMLTTTLLRLLSGGKKFSFTMNQLIIFLLIKVKKEKHAIFEKNLFSETSGNLGFGLISYEGIDPKDNCFLMQ